MFEKKFEILEEFKKRTYLEHLTFRVHYQGWSVPLVVERLQFCKLADFGEKLFDSPRVAV